MEEGGDEEVDEDDDEEAVDDDDMVRAASSTREQRVKRGEMEEGVKAERAMEGTQQREMGELENTPRRGRKDLKEEAEEEKSRVEGEEE